MGFLDSIRDRFGGNGGDDYYDEDEYYEDETAGYAERRRDTGSATRLLGNTPRPEAESVSVYTRSGRPVANQVPMNLPSTAQASYDTQATNAIPRGGYQSPSAPAPVPVQSRAEFGGAARRGVSAQLPPYVLRPVAYDDVQTVVRRVKTNQPVVLVFRNTNIEVAKRILDFSFGFSMGIDGEVSELGDRCFAVLPAGAQLTATDINKLVADGDLVR